MQEIKCPRCGEVFVVDETGYAQIVQQVRDKEFEQELKQREQELEKTKDKDLELAQMEQQKEFDKLLLLKETELNEKDKAIDQLRAQIAGNEMEKKIAINEAVIEKDKERENAVGKKNDELAEKDRLIEQLKAKIENNENEKKLAVSEAVIEKNEKISQKIKEITALKEKFSAEDNEKNRVIEELKATILANATKNELAISKAINEKEKERENAIEKKNDELAEKNHLIAELKMKISENETEKKLAINETINRKEKEREEAIKKKNDELSENILKINELKSKIKNNEAEMELAVSKALQKKEKEIFEKENEITKLKSQLLNKVNENELKERNLRKEYEKKLKDQDELIEYYKDFKARQSTKMIGESLEQHCSNQFNSLRMAAFPNAHFEKDNDARTGSKGDFIFRESVDGIEFISIMFEMKNEMDETATKHKNEDFLKELDKDRREKKCEYAVLVSLLEIDNELYNGGIVDVSYKYEKMYIIRPQFFIPMITLLRNAALNSLKYRQELEIARNQQVDILHFEDNMNEFKNGFARNYRIASEKFKTAIDEIDKTISHLQKTRDALVSSENNLRLANKKAEDLSIKKLTKNAPTVKKMFDELKNGSTVE